MPILLGLFIGQPLLLPLLLGFCSLRFFCLPGKLLKAHIQTCELHLHILCLLDDLISLLIGLEAEQRCQLWGYGGGQEEKRSSLFESLTFYPLVPLVATLQDTAEISQGLSLAPCICPLHLTFDHINLHV